MKEFYGNYKNGIHYIDWVDENYMGTGLKLRFKAYLCGIGLMMADKPYSQTGLLSMMMTLQDT